MSKSSKRILSVTVFRVCDTDADTSYLGEYGNTAKTKYAIDRAHDLDCIENDQLQKQKLERIADFLESFQSEYEHLSSPNGCAEGCEACEEENAYFEAAETVRALAECDSDGCSRRYDSREYRFFNPSDDYKGEAPEDIFRYVRQDYERMESLHRGAWSYIGIKAEAEILVSANTSMSPKERSATCSHITQRIKSGGLYGIESDSDKSYLAEIQREELAALKTELIALGFSKRAISKAFQDVKERED